MQIVAIIPARLESTRLPRKLLLEETGRPLIQHTVTAVRAYEPFSRVIVATDSDEIAAACDQYTHVVKTGESRNGTERVASILDQIDADLIVNVQADEPEVEQSHLAALIEAAIDIPGCDMATLATTATVKDQESESVVKVERSNAGFAQRFSRKGLQKGMRHIGVYAYRPDFLRWFVAQRPTQGEQAEHLEQLRALDKGCRIRVGMVQHAERGIDTQEEYAAFVARFLKKQER